MRIRKPKYRYWLYHPVAWIMSKFGHWTWEHEFKTCPTGERHCPHVHYHLGKLPD